MKWVLVFFVSFISMEGVAWWLHKYVMHGILWNLHKDHHQPVAGRGWQRNDWFAVFFAVPSFLLILAGRFNEVPVSEACGFGIMAYGIAYFFVHEVILHRRFKFIRIKPRGYFRVLNVAHKIHHSVKDQYNCENFGMLKVPASFSRYGKSYRRQWR